MSVFRRDLKQSHDDSSDAWSQDFYSRCFDGFKRAYFIKNDKFLQKAGDRIIETDRGNFIVEEKFRSEWRSADLLIETHSVFERNVAGWIYKEIAGAEELMSTKRFVYGSHDERIAHVFLFRKLVFTWLDHEREWNRSFDWCKPGKSRSPIFWGTTHSQTGRIEYHTRNVAVKYIDLSAAGLMWKTVKW